MTLRGTSGVLIARCPEHGLHGDRTTCFVCDGPVEQVALVPLAEYDELRDAAMWVVLNWDTEQTQHLSMPALRKALGLPSARPTREEAQARLTSYINLDLTNKDFGV